jgi:serine/threonine protein kinase
VLKNIKHPFILHAGSFFQDDMYLYMVMDFCAGGDLEKKINKGRFS